MELGDCSLDAEPDFTEHLKNTAADLLQIIQSHALRKLFS